ncbi:hypothetical protein [Cohnella algarum]|uniref:hypothetical protein n=1 Tax=Cohnella algarum TaxID=2044859 RepID=UPI0019678EDA|nr:hypothetical protein [Cohnella algarum]MBN2980148.1 hypothetical protein [Cohnella algarum]
MHLKEVADKLVRRLKSEGFAVQRYDAFSTSSVYLKLDFGVCNSVRISDHEGKRHLNYRYNLIRGCQKAHSTITPEGWKRHFFPISEVDALIDQIQADRYKKLQIYGTKGYQALMEHNREKHQNDNGFWRNSQIV